MVRKPKVDVTNPANYSYYATQLLNAAVEMVTDLEATNAQGAVVWDLPGDEFLQPIGYEDVRGGIQLPPEMADSVDVFFKKFTDAGLRCGVLINRATYEVTNTPGFTGSTDQIVYRYNYEDPETTYQIMDRKMSLAHDRWGCTLFYVDSGGAQGWPIDARIYQRLQQTHPDCLLIPEQKTLEDYAWTAPFGTITQYDNNEHRVAFPFLNELPMDAPISDQARWIYPNAFGVLFTSDITRDLQPGSPLWNQLVQAVRNGDVLMYGVPAKYPIPKIVEIYREASSFAN